MKAPRYLGALIILIVLAAVFVYVPIALLPEPTPPPPDPNDPLVQDAQELARASGIELEDAIRRLELQGEIGELGAAIEANEPETFAGFWIQHEPEYRVVAAFTRDGEKIIREYVDERLLGELVEVRTYKWSHQELLEAQEAAYQALRVRCIEANAGLNVQENRAEVYVLDAEEAESALREANANLLERIALIEVEQLATMDAAIEGALSYVDGCLRVGGAQGGEGSLLVLPPWYSLQIEGDLAQIVDENGEVVARSGDKIFASGGELSVEAMDACMSRRVNLACSGPYWFAGEIDKSEE